MIRFVEYVVILAFLMGMVDVASEQLIRGVWRDQYSRKSYANKNIHKIANEFQLINPATITKKNDKHSFSPSSSLPSSSEVDLEDAHNQHRVLPDTYSITTVTPTAIKNNDIVHISYTTNNAAEGDWIAAYSPATVDINERVPVRFAMCDMDLQYLGTGSGTLRFNFTNLREDVKFVYYHNGTDYPVEGDTSSTTVSFIDPNEPLKARVVPTGDIDEFTVIWSTNNSANPTLKWGTTQGGPYTTTVSATTSRMTQDQMCGGEAKGIGWRDLGALHSAALTGMSSLPSRTQIYYIYGDSVTNVYSNETIFTTPLLPGERTSSSGANLKALLLCDLGRGNDDKDDSETWDEYGRPAYNTSRFAAARAGLGDVDLVFHGGDISYARGFEAVWDFWLNMISPLASRVLYLTTIGNHEADWTLGNTLYGVTDSGGECDVTSTTMMPMPAPATLKPNEPWWSYDVGMVHFVGMSTEHPYDACSQQYAWIESDLASVNRTKTPWIVFQGHRPMYVSSDFNDTSLSYSDTSVQNLLISQIEPLLFKYSVNFAFWGHNHVYQRMSAVYKENVVQASVAGADLENTVNTARVYNDPQATVQLLIGNAGASFSANWLNPLQDWCERASSFWGYNMMEVFNATHMQITVYNTNNYETESIEDILVISQSPWTESFPSYSWSLPDTEAFANIDTSCATCESSTSSGIGVNTYYTAVGCILGGTLILLGVYLYARRLGYCGGIQKTDLHKSLLDDSDISVNIDTTSNPIVATSGSNSIIHSSVEHGTYKHPSHIDALNEVEVGQGDSQLQKHHARVDALNEKA